MISYTKTNVTSKALQEPGIEIYTVVKLYDNLLSYFRQIREQFDEFEKQAKVLVNADYSEVHRRKRLRKAMPDDGPAPNVDLNPREKFRVKVFNTIVDRLISEIDKRRRSYDNVNELFGFLTDRQISSSDIKQKATHLVEAYQCDLEEAFVDEIQLFLPLCASDMSVSLMLQNMIENKLVSSFPNVNIAFRIY